MSTTRFGPVAASGLVVVHVEAGHCAVFTSRERGEKQLGVLPASARRYVQDRARENALAVRRVLGGEDLS